MLKKIENFRIQLWAKKISIELDYFHCTSVKLAPGRQTVTSQGCTGAKCSAADLLTYIQRGKTEDWGPNNPDHNWSFLVIWAQFKCYFSQVSDNHDNVNCGKEILTVVCSVVVVFSSISCAGVASRNQYWLSTVTVTHRSILHGKWYQKVKISVRLVKWSKPWSPVDTGPVLRLWCY